MQRPIVPPAVSDRSQTLSWNQGQVTRHALPGSRKPFALLEADNHRRTGISDLAHTNRDQYQAHARNPFSEPCPHNKPPQQPALVEQGQSESFDRLDYMGYVFPHRILNFTKSLSQSQ